MSLSSRTSRVPSSVAGDAMVHRQSKAHGRKKIKECSVVTETGQANYGGLMRRYAESQTVKCNYRGDTSDTIKREEPIKKLCTGSIYEGTWDSLGMTGYGTYIFPSGQTMYEGDFEGGVFHGEGEFKFKGMEGVTLKGRFEKGIMTEKTLIFADGLQYEETDWKYSERKDRRYTDEFSLGIQPAGQTFMCPSENAPEVPPGMYDTCDGFYNPETKLVHKQDDLGICTRAPGIAEQKWIMENCRFGGKKFGYRPGLYEEWAEPELELKKPPVPSVKMTNIEEDDLDNDSCLSTMSLSTFNFPDNDEHRRSRRRSTITQKRKLLFYNIDESVDVAKDIKI